MLSALVAMAGSGEATIKDDGSAGCGCNRARTRQRGLKRTPTGCNSDADDEDHVKQDDAQADTGADPGPFFGGGSGGDGLIVTSCIPFRVDLGRIDDGDDAERQTAAYRGQDSPGQIVVRFLRGLGLFGISGVADSEECILFHVSSFLCVVFPYACPVRRHTAKIGKIAHKTNDPHHLFIVKVPNVGIGLCVRRVKGAKTASGIFAGLTRELDPWILQNV